MRCELGGGHSMMRALSLEVLASTSIKRRKPWPSVVFMGEVQESLMLFDTTRASILYAPSGKTKRKVNKLQPHLADTVLLNTSRNGNFLVGLLKSGDLYIWHKDSDTLRQVQGLPELASTKDSDKLQPRVFVDDDGTKLVVVVAPYSLVLIWEVNSKQDFFVPGKSRLQGSWSQVVPTKSTILPTHKCHLPHIDVVFVKRPELGACCLCSFVFNYEDKMCCTTLTLRWFDVKDVYSLRQPTYQADWSSHCTPFSSLATGACAIHDNGTFLSRFTNDGQVLAIVVNQRDINLSRLVFHSPWTVGMVVTDLKSLGVKKPEAVDTTKSYWICDLAWTADDLYLCLVTEQGCFAMLTRLGELVHIQTHGQSMSMGPRHYLPLHPVMTVQTDGKTDIGLQQRFSVSCHPRLPIVLVSDGFMVTALQLPADTSCLSLVTQLVDDASHHLQRVRDQHNIDASLFDTLRNKLKHDKKKQRRQLQTVDTTRSNVLTQSYTFEAPCKDALEDSIKAAGNSTFYEALAGKLMFGDVGNMNETVDFVGQEADLADWEHLERGLKDLMGAWGLLVSHSGVWTQQHEDVAQSVTHHMTRLCAVLIHIDPSVLLMLKTSLSGGTLKIAKKKKKSQLGLSMVLGLCGNFLELLEMDRVQKNLQVCALEMVHSLTELLSTAAQQSTNHLPAHYLKASFSLLTHANLILSKTYQSVASGTHVNSIPYDKTSAVSMNNSDLYMSSSQCSLLKKSEYQDTTQESPQRPRTRLVSDKRLKQSWLVLYQHTTRLYKQILTTCLSGQTSSSSDKHQELKSLRPQMRDTLQLLFTLQCKLHAMNCELPQGKKPRKRLLPGNKLAIEGAVNPAIYSWLQYAESSSEHTAQSRMMSSMVHGALYGLLLQDALQGAVELSVLLFQQSDVRRAASIWTQDQEARTTALSLTNQSPPSELTSPPLLLVSPVARHTVLSLARVMAAYFSNTSLYVYPPHAAVRLPPLHTSQQPVGRVVPLYHDSLSTSIRQHQLGDVWTAERAINYLLLAGSHAEAVWFLKSLNDWKAAVILGVACFHHSLVCPDLYERNKKLVLPPDLMPEYILKSHLQCLVPDTEASDKVLQVTEETDLDHLSDVIHDILTMATVCNIDLVTWLLKSLLSRLITVAASFQALVPEGLYLPAPPVYCPQPAPDDLAELSSEVSQEVELRRQVSSLILLINLVLTSTHSVLPAASWYAQRVLQAFSTNLQHFKKRSEQQVVMDIEQLREKYLETESSLQGQESLSSVHLVLTCVRDVCTLSWMFYARDKLSLALRNKAKMARQLSEKPEELERYIEQCSTALQWARQLLPFSRLLSDPDSQLYSAFLSLVIEHPANHDSAKILAEHCYNVEDLDPVIQDKLVRILYDWKGIVDLDKKPTGKKDQEKDLESVLNLPVESPRGVPLSVYYHSKAKTVNKLFSKRERTFGAFDEFVFDPQKTTPLGEEQLCVGSRFCETTQEYLQFLDTFYALSFNRELPQANDKRGPPRPLFIEFGREIRKKELNSLQNTKAVGPQKKPPQRMHQGDHIISIGNPKSPMSPRYLQRQSSMPTAKPPRNRPGLFRSNSMCDMRGQNQKAQPSAMTRASSEDDLRKAGKRAEEKQSRRRRKASVASIDADVLLEEDDPLLAPLVPQWKLDKMVLPKKYQRIERELEWLEGWASRNHTLLPDSVSNKSAMKLRVSPKFMAYSLWLVENCHYHPDRLGSEKVRPVDVTVNMVHGVKLDNTDSPTNLCCSPLRRTPKKMNKKNPPTKPTVDKKDTKLAHKKPKDINNDQMVVRDEVVENITMETVGATFMEDTGPRKKLSFTLPQDNPEDDTGCDSDESLDVSSLDEEQVLSSLTLLGTLRVEDLAQTPKPTVSTPPDPIRSPEPTPIIQSPSYDPPPIIQSPMTTIVHHSPPTPDSWASVEPQRENQTTPGQDVTDGQASDVQGIVRQELRRIMEAQQMGIVAMLDALDGQPKDSQPVVEQVIIPQKSGARKTKPLSEPQQSQRSDNSTHGHPLTMSELTRDSPHNGTWKPAGVGGVLNELKLLEKQHHSELTHAKDLCENKENINHGIPLLHYPVSTYQTPEQTSNVPYTGLMEALREMNKDLLGRSKSVGQPKLIAERDHHEHIIKLPDQPKPLRPAWMDNTDNTPFPLLHLNNKKPDMFLRQPAERDTSLPFFQESRPELMKNSEEFVVPFPLLHLPEVPSRRQAARGPPQGSLGALETEDQEKIIQETEDKMTRLQEVDLATKSATPKRSHRRKKPKTEKKVRPARETKKKVVVDEDAEEASQHESSKQSAREKDPTVPEKLHPGYALPHGLFDEYLEKEIEHGTVPPSSASVQYHAATNIKPKPTEPLKKDMYTETDPVVDQTRSTGTGTSPIKTKVEREPSNILPPDVFMALKFSELSGQQESSGKDPSFINVVDINGDLLEEITRSQRSQQRSQQKSPRRSQSPLSFRPQRQSQEEDAGDDETSPVVRGPDTTTQRIIGQTSTNVPNVDPHAMEEVTRGNRYKTKQDIRRRLMDMNDQFSAISNMQTNIEREFNSTKLLMHTIDKLSESAVPEREEPTAGVLSQLDQTMDSAERDQQDDDTLTPHTDSPHSTPRSSQGTPRKASPRQKQPQKEERDVALSGLSGVSDIVGDMLAKGEVDAEQLGLSQLQAQRLIDKARASVELGVRLSSEELGKVFREYSTAKKSPRTEPQKGRSEREKKELREWMKQQKAVRQREYSQRMKELRGKEAQPFRGTPTSTGITQEAEGKKETRKKALLKEFEEQRKKEASLLMGNILEDTVSVGGEEAPVTVRSRAGSQERSRARREISPSSSRKRATSLPRKVAKVKQEVPMTATYVMERREPRPVKDATRVKPRSKPVVAEEQPRSYKEMVRLQRPDVTKPRTVRSVPRPSTGPSTSQPASAASQADRQKLYGSKRLPGTYKKTERHAPRVVKPYTERLNDMRKEHKLTGKVYKPQALEKADTRVMRGGRLTEVAPPTHTSPRQTLTYAQQLQALQPPKQVQYWTKPRKVVKPQPKPWRGPKHPPKTYGEQLRELQHPDTAHRHDEHLVYRSPTRRTQGRRRPYADPYSQADEDQSVLSSWSMESDVHKLIYDDSHREATPHYDGDLDISELRDLADLDSAQAEYSQLVDIRDIAEVSSVSGSSIMSFIDWDQVDQLISEA